MRELASGAMSFILATSVSSANAASPIPLDTWRQYYHGRVQFVHESGKNTHLIIQAPFDDRSEGEHSSKRKVSALEDPLVPKMPPMHQVTDEVKPKGVNRGFASDDLIHFELPRRTPYVVVSPVNKDVIRKGAFVEIYSCEMVNNRTLRVPSMTILDSTLGDKRVRILNGKPIPFFQPGAVQSGKEKVHARGFISNTDPLQVTLPFNGQQVAVNLQLAPDCKPNWEFHGSDLNLIEEGTRAALKVDYVACYEGSPDKLAKLNRLGAERFGKAMKVGPLKQAEEVTTDSLGRAISRRSVTIASRSSSGTTRKRYAGGVQANILKSGSRRRENSLEYQIRKDVRFYFHLSEIKLSLDEVDAAAVDEWKK